MNPTREIMWGANSIYPAKSIKIKNLSDTHLANIIHWIKERINVYGQDILTILTTEATTRNLPPEFLAQRYPAYNNYTLVNGEWMAT